MTLTLSVNICALFIVWSVAEEPRPPCPSEIYCHGPLLHTIQMAHIHQDSKHFVDMKLKNSPKVTLDNFSKLEPNATKSDLEKFLEDNFEDPGSEFENWIPGDWKPKPKLLDKVPAKHDKWITTLHSLWKELGRKMKHDVRDNPDYYSIIYVPNPVIIPGGRFREFYYWDSYWIIQGLLHSEMHVTAKGMLENYLYMIEKLGLVPNGGRIYYNERSQPPLLIPMVKTYYEFTKDVGFLKKNLDGLIKEYDYWTTTHTRDVAYKGKHYKLSTYGAGTVAGPRPESYREDYKGAEMLPEDLKNAFYTELRAAAESGWDFSSRWYVKNGTNRGNLTNTKTTSIVPVDLNAILYWNAKLLAEFSDLCGRKSDQTKFNGLANKRLEAISEVLWDQTEGIWLDYDLINDKRRNYFSASNMAPLWTGAFQEKNRDEISKAVLKYLRKEGRILPGGIPTTVEQTGEQWDFPNAWPPLQHYVIAGLDNLGTDESKKLAEDLSQKWIESNALGYKETDAMFEKYDATKPGKYGGGGEYEVQLGFGWTNGIILELFSKYPDPSFKEEPAQPPPSTADNVYSNQYTVLVLFLIALLFKLVP